ncbi:aconitate hydratase [Pleosporales sp. CAS-2024a]
MSEERRPPSRFDTEDTERPIRSRFDTDRRSRSPARREPESHRARSPVARGASDSPSAAAAGIKNKSAAALAAAARINAQIQAKKGIQHVDVPPIRSAQTPPVVKSPASGAGQAVSGDMYQQDGDYIKDIEINDLRNRYTLTKGAVQKRIKDETGADVTTRGEYYPDKNMATAASPPLYLRVTSTSKEGLDQATKMIEDMMKEDLPNLVDERRFRRREPENFERDEFGRRKWPEEKISVGLEPISGFNLRAQVVGRGGDNVKYIQQETSCKVQIKGRGSGFMELQSGQESDEPMYLHIAGPRPEGVARAKELCEELLEKVKADYQAYKDRPPPSRNYGDRDGFGNGRSSYSDRGDRGDRQRSESYGYGGGHSAYGGQGAYGASNDARSPSVATPADQNAQAVDYNAQYAQWAAYYAQNPAEDPYAAYGGFAAVMAQYQQAGATGPTAAAGYGSYYGQAYGQAQSPAAPGASAGAPPPPPPPSDNTGYGAPPPPPPSDNTGYGAPPPPPPPPPTASPPGGYSAVPPPPAL